MESSSAVAFRWILFEYKGGHTMTNYRCTMCGYLYRPERGDPASGIEPGTEFPDLPDDWKCPSCGAGKEFFKPVE